MDIYSFLFGVGITVAGGILLYWIVLIIEHPDLEILPETWHEKKWVGRFLGDIKYYSTDRGGEAWVDGYDFMIYGISIKNKRRKLLPRKTAHIRSTALTMFNSHGDQTSELRECRWWSHDMSSLDNLFVPTKIDISQRRNLDIPEDVSKNLVIAYCHLGQSTYRIFAIDSDRVESFNSNEDRIKGDSPYYALINIRGDNVSRDIKLELIQNKSDLSINTINKFPFD